MPNPHAIALGKLARGKKKTLTPAERTRRRTALDKVRRRGSGRTNGAMSSGGGL